jgi:hypothetical protein
MAAAQVVGTTRDAGGAGFIACRFAAQSRCAQLGECSRLKDGENLSFGDHVIELDEDRFQLAGGRRSDRDFHLHGFDEGDIVAVADACSDFHGKRTHPSGYLGDNLDVWHSIPPNGLNKTV